MSASPKKDGTEIEVEEIEEVELKLGKNYQSEMVKVTNLE